LETKKDYCLQDKDTIFNTYEVQVCNCRGGTTKFSLLQ